MTPTTSTAEPVSAREVSMREAIAMLEDGAQLFINGVAFVLKHVSYAVSLAPMPVGTNGNELLELFRLDAKRSSARQKWEASHAAIVARRLVTPPRPVTLGSSTAISSPRTSRSARRRRARSRSALGRAHPLNRST